MGIARRLSSELADKFATTIESSNKFEQDVLYANFRVAESIFLQSVTSSALI